MAGIQAISWRKQYRHVGIANLHKHMHFVVAKEEKARPNHSAKHRCGTAGRDQRKRETTGTNVSTNRQIGRIGQGSYSSLARQYELRRNCRNNGNDRFERIGKTDADKGKIERDGKFVR